MQTTRFEIPFQTATYTPSDINLIALALLDSIPAVVIYTSPSFIIYELGIPVPYFVAESSGISLIHTPQWWIDKSAAEIRAGPWADETDLRKAESKMKELETKRRKTVRKTSKQKEIEWKLEEGLRRQEAGLKMYEDGKDEEDACDDGDKVGDGENGEEDESEIDEMHVE
jgi:hypothetical protein